ncbi:DUF6526 family protein [Paenibacillus sp. N3.4]|uniref:DUF6526 family protein n=1 Tax=Paenibacillus sp. N3.4 TaxID=2603222 RepID=UPI0011C8E239|nr:DUF6526 family protein [Paenibacillus sp. N3.4]TXK81453.1 hypothetical protein FU659_16265 [Paenibacillus sp. N3.4]
MSHIPQNYANHKRIHPLFHMILSLLILVLFVSSIFELVRSFCSGIPVFPAFLMLLVSLIVLIIFLLLRSYPLKAQDRAVRAEENLRHYVLTQQLFDPRLTMGQIVALRFASDSEFPALCQKAAAENMSPDAIKKAIRSWRSDYYRI